MINIVNKSECCGCTACCSVCTKQAIIMKRDEEGFFYPEIKKEKCIDCGLCDSICPVKFTPENRSGVLEIYAVQHKDKEILFHSASGGAFSAIGDLIIQLGGTVYGAAYDTEMTVRHLRTDNAENLPLFRSSKYVQSQQDNTYSHVKNDLLSDRWVCYSGTPCQVAGLKKYLKKDYKKLITIDIVCKGVASPEVLRQYVKLMEKKYNSTIIGMNFKRKTYGYHSSTMSVDFANGKTYSRGGITDPMMRSFRANICLRPSCEKCHFKGTERASDITLFDCWSYERLTRNKDNDEGYTAVMIHTKKGAEVLSKCKCLNADKIDLDEAIKYDGIMVNNCTNVHPKRQVYMDILKEKGLESAIKSVIPISAREKMIDSSKSFLYRVGLLKTIKNFKSRLAHSTQRLGI